MKFPASIGCVAVVAPAFPIDGKKFDAGLDALRASGVHVKLMPHCRGAAQGLFAASDAERAADFQEAWSDPAVDLILCARGGYGCARILPLLDFEALKRCGNDVVVSGFSDVTALLFAMDRFGAGIPLAGPMLVSLAERNGETERAFASAIDGQAPEWGTLRVLRPGTARGRVLAGNLAVAASLAGTPYLPDSAGRILVLEEVGEPAYKVDRMLNQLSQAGWFARCAAVVFGYCTDCKGVDGVLEAWAARWNCPVRSGLRFGHEFPSLSFNFRTVSVL